VVVKKSIKNEGDRILFILYAFGPEIAVEELEHVVKTDG